MKKILTIILALMLILVSNSFARGNSEADGITIRWG